MKVASSRSYLTHRISYRVGQIVVTAQPDLWVEENGTEVLLKIGIAKKKPSYVDILLTVIRKAAVSLKMADRRCDLDMFFEQFV